MEQRKRGGRQSKGDRRPMIARLPRDLADAAQEQANQQGMTFNDFVGELLADELGMHYDSQEKVPLAKSA